MNRIPNKNNGRDNTKVVNTMDHRLKIEARLYPKELKTLEINPFSEIAKQLIESLN